MNKRKSIFKEINAMALPIILDYLVSISFETVDKAMISRYSTEGFASVGLAGSFLYSITGALGILCSAYGIMAGKAKGQDDANKYWNLFHIAMKLTVIIGAVFSLIAVVSGRLFFKSFYGIGGSLLDSTCSYYKIASLTVLLNMMAFQFSALFRNERNTKVTLAADITSSLVNIVLDYVLIYGRFGFPELGASGAAISTVIGLICGNAVYFIKYLNLKKNYKIISLKKQLQDVKQMVKLYIPLLLQDLTEYTLFGTIIMAIIARLGTFEIATYNLITTINGYIILPAYAYGTVAMTLFIQNKEKGEAKKSHNMVKKSMIMCVAVISAAAALILIFSKSVVMIFSDDTAVIKNVKSLLWFPVLSQIVYGIMQIYKYVLQGCNFEKYVFIVNLIFCVVSCAISFILVRLYGLYGVFIGTFISYLGNIILLYCKYYSEAKN